jgi:hypothetical protein
VGVVDPKVVRFSVSADSGRFRGRAGGDERRDDVLRIPENHRLAVDAQGE